MTATVYIHNETEVHDPDSRLYRSKGQPPSIESFEISDLQLYVKMATSRLENSKLDVTASEAAGLWMLYRDRLSFSGDLSLTEEVDRVYRDSAMNTFATRLGEAMGLLYMEKKGYPFHQPWAANTSRSKSKKRPDYLVGERRRNYSTVLECKGTVNRGAAQFWTKSVNDEYGEKIHRKLGDSYRGNKIDKGVSAGARLDLTEAEILVALSDLDDINDTSRGNSSDEPRSSEHERLAKRRLSMLIYMMKLVDHPENLWSGNISTSELSEEFYELRRVEYFDRSYRLAERSRIPNWINEHGKVQDVYLGIDEGVFDYLLRLISKDGDYESKKTMPQIQPSKDSDSEQQFYAASFGDGSISIAADDESDFQ